MPNYGNLYDGSFQVGDLVEVVYSRVATILELQVGSSLLVVQSPRGSRVMLEGGWIGDNVEIRKVNESRVSKMYFKDWYRETFECQK